MSVPSPVHADRNPFERGVARYHEVARVSSRYIWEHVNCSRYRGEHAYTYHEVALVAPEAALALLHHVTAAVPHGARLLEDRNMAGEMTTCGPQSSPDRVIVPHLQCCIAVACSSCCFSSSAAAVAARAALAWPKASWFSRAFEEEARAFED